MPRTRSVVRIAALGGTLISAACGQLPTAPSAHPAAAASTLAPSGPSSAGRSGYMLSSGLIDAREADTK